MSVLCQYQQIHERAPHLPSATHTTRFLKKYMRFLEDSQLTIVDSMLELYAQLMMGTRGESIMENNMQSWFCLDMAQSHSPAASRGSADLVELLQSDRMLDGGGTTGTRTWEAGYFLAEYVAQHPGLFRNQSVLELGSGAGLVGAMCALLGGARELYLSDRDAGVLRLLEGNMAQNENAFLASAYGTLPRIVELDWSTVSGKDLCAYAADVVLAADCAYSPDLIAPLVRVLGLILQDAKQYALIVTSLRRPETFASLLEQLRRVGLSFQPADLSIGSGDTAATTAGKPELPAGWRFFHDYNMEDVRTLRIERRT